MQSFSVLGLATVLLGNLAAAQLAPWVYLGCVDETDTRTLEGASIANNMTIDTCLAFCATTDYALAGLEYGNECYCGNNLRNGAAVGKDGCNMPCTSAANQTCGGVARLSVYSNPNYQPVAIVPSVTSSGANPKVYNSLGCTTEGKTERALSGSTSASAAMTPQLCVDTCAAASYSYAGVEYATECYCGNTLSNQTASATAGQCNMKCGGNPKAFCGGPDRLVVYQTTLA